MSRSTSLLSEQESSTNLDSPRTGWVECNMCGSEHFFPVLDKASSMGEIFHVVSCVECGLVQVNPQPTVDAVKPYYQDNYFKQRSDRGYDNYYSSAVRDQIRSVYEQNLRDLGFFDYEHQVFQDQWLQDNLAVGRRGTTRQPVALDAGCAAGYFVALLADRGWDARGVELSESASAYARQELGLNVVTGDFLDGDALNHQLKAADFDLVTFWASIEHMHDPRRVLERCRELLRPGGRLLLSTCRYGLLARLRGANWRYMNVPEHLYYFSLRGLERLAVQCGFRVVKHVTYGSGFTAHKDMSLFYKAGKRIADPLVKLLDQGDMMAFHFVRE